MKLRIQKALINERTFSLITCYTNLLYWSIFTWTCLCHQHCSQMTRKQRNFLLLSSWLRISYCHQNLADKEANLTLIFHALGYSVKTPLWALFQSSQLVKLGLRRQFIWKIILSLVMCVIGVNKIRYQWALFFSHCLRSVEQIFHYRIVGYRKKRKLTRKLDAPGATVWNISSQWEKFKNVQGFRSYPKRHIKAILHHQGTNETGKKNYHVILVLKISQIPSVDTSTKKENIVQTRRKCPHRPVGA